MVCLIIRRKAFGVLHVSNIALQKSAQFVTSEILKLSVQYAGVHLITIITRFNYVRYIRFAKNAITIRISGVPSVVLENEFVHT